MFTCSGVKLPKSLRIILWQEQYSMSDACSVSGGVQTVFIISLLYNLMIVITTHHCLLPNVWGFGCGTQTEYALMTKKIRLFNLFCWWYIQTWWQNCHQIIQLSLLRCVLSLQRCDIRSVMQSRCWMVLTWRGFWWRRMWYPGFFLPLWFLSVTQFLFCLLFWFWRRIQGLFPAWLLACGDYY